MIGAALAVYVHNCAYTAIDAPIDAPITGQETHSMRKIAKSNYFELAVFLMHYHSGQWSRGYRLLSRLSLSNLSSAAEHECTESECYQYLVAHYADKV